MEIKEKLEEYLEEDIIEKIYDNELYLSEVSPKNKEYISVCKKCSNLSSYLVNKMVGKDKNKFLEYIEQNSIKESIEAEFQFKLGFKTAIKIILEGLK